MMDATATFFSSFDSVTVLLEQAVPALVNILAGIGTLIIGF